MFLPPQQSLADGDAAVRSTDDDAAHARLSALRKGYFEDPFTPLLVSKAHLVAPRPPLINIGTFIRSKAIDNLIKNWISLQDGPVQIVSLGSGSDSRFWRFNCASNSAQALQAFPVRNVKRYSQTLLTDPRAQSKDRQIR